uniref:Cuticlin-1 n=1 Tax=Aceria tosichella TaxID=561515 RepID=A0A6G1SIX7_9ACAR
MEEKWIPYEGANNRLSQGNQDHNKNKDYKKISFVGTRSSLKMFAKPPATSCKMMTRLKMMTPRSSQANKLEQHQQNNKRALSNHHRLAIFIVIVQASLLVSLIEPASAFYSSTSSSITFDGSNNNNNNAIQDQTFNLSPSASQHQQPAQHHQQVSHKSPLNGRQFGDTINDIQIECNSNNIVVTLQTNQGFNGMIYPKGLSKNSTCMMEYHQMSSNITYYLPLKSCNTMSTDVEDGVEYFNTVMVQPHRRLVTNQGRGYHIRCRYQTKERVITNQDQQLNVNLTQSTPSVMGSASMPSCTMRIYSSNDLSHEVSAENVRIGDELQLIINLDDQDVYGMLVTNCLVRDGMNWGEQPLIDDHGCPVDEEIMPEFTYAKNLTRASVAFQAHKFPYTSSVYYQCNVRLCFRDNNGCSHVPPNCNRGPQHGLMGGAAADRQHHQAFNYKSNSLEHNLGPANNEALPSASSSSSSHKQRSSARTKRWIDAGELDGVASEELLDAARPKVPRSARDLTIEVTSGLHVDESELEAGATEATSGDTATAAALSSADTASDRDPLLALASNDDATGDDATASSPGVQAGANDNNDDQTPASERANKQRSEREFCMSLRRFAIIISLISLLLMTAIIIMIACLIQRRNKRKLEAQMQHSPYHNDHHHHSNRAYCRD